MLNPHTFSGEPEKPDRYIQDGILIAIDTDKEYLSDNMAFMNKDI